MIVYSIIQAQIKENIKAPRHWPLWGEFTAEFPVQRASNAENEYHTANKSKRVQFMHSVTLYCVTRSQCIV